MVISNDFPFTNSMIFIPKYVTSVASRGIAHKLELKIKTKDHFNISFILLDNV